MFTIVTTFKNDPNGYGQKDAISNTLAGAVKEAKAILKDDEAHDKVVERTAIYSTFSGLLLWDSILCKDSYKEA